MRKIILASHGSLAEGMLSAGKMILGNCYETYAFGLDTYHNPIDIYQKVESMVKGKQDEFIILCDINGGSVHNQMLHLCKYRNVLLITGMTLSMFLEIMLDEGHTPAKLLLQKVAKSASDNILIFDYESVAEQIKQGIEDDNLW